MKVFAMVGTRRTRIHPDKIIFVSENGDEFRVYPQIDENGLVVNLSGTSETNQLVLFPRFSNQCLIRSLTAIHTGGNK